MARRTKGPQTARTRAIEAFLSVHRHQDFGPGDLCDWLTAHGVPLNRMRCGTELGRRVREGYLVRLGRARYRVPAGQG